MAPKGCSTVQKEESLSCGTYTQKCCPFPNPASVYYASSMNPGLDIEKGKEDANLMKDVIDFVFNHQGTLV